MRKPQTAEELFRIIREFFDAHDDYVAFNEKNKVYTVFSGIRGPDISRNHILANRYGWLEPQAMKSATTAVIRNTLMGENILADTHADDESAPFIRQSLKKFRENGTISNPILQEFDHFISHAQMAFEALGLNWDEVNK